MDTNSENVVEVKDKVIERVKVFDKKKLAIIIPVAIILIAAIIVFANRNLIMGNYNCEKGNYQAAITYYSKIKKIKGKTLSQYQNLRTYESGKDALIKDDMQTLSSVVANLKNVTTEYPTKSEINQLNIDYEKRNEEIKKNDTQIEEVTKLFSDVTKVSDIIGKCDELKKNKLTQSQISQVDEIKKVASAYVEIKGEFDKGNNEAVVEKIEQLSGVYQKYGISNKFGELNEKAQFAIEERKSIDEKLINIRNDFDSENYDICVYQANELLKMKLSEEEKKEVETIKSTSETKVAEAKAKAEQEEAAAKAKADKEAIEEKQRTINEAIRVSATTLYEEFNTNNVGAETKYKGKTLLVTGTVYNIDKTFFLGTAYVHLMAGYITDGVTAYFSVEGESQLTNITQGQTISILGKCSGRSLGSAILNDCVLVN